VAADEQLSVTVYVRPNPDRPGLPDPEDADITAVGLDDDEFEALYAADPADIQRVVAFAERSRLTVLDASPVKRSVLMRGSAKDVMSAFNVKLRRYRAGEETFRGRSGVVRVPADLADVVEAVFGLDDRQVGFPHLRSNRAIGRAAIDVARTTGLPAFTYLPPTVADIYRFPAGTTGEGQCIAILCFNFPDSHGGYSRAALKTYFEQVLGLPLPEIVDVVVHGQGNDPGGAEGDAEDPFDTTIEVMLDVQMAGGCAPRAKLVAYFTRFTEQGWVDALNTIVTDSTHRPSVISISYGNPEDDPHSSWTASAIAKVNEAFRAAAAKGITICCASGDDGSRDQGTAGTTNTDFPASSPYVLGCGGTRLVASNGVVHEEVVWNDGPGSATGGGVSRCFPVPKYQQHANVPLSADPDRRSGRGVPDVSGIADPNTGVVIISADGVHLSVVGGTSVTAPMWSALVARLNEAVGGRLGFLNPTLYSLQHLGVLRDITYGDNGAYGAAVGWDACTGLGSPDGTNLLTALAALISASTARAMNRAVAFSDGAQAFSAELNEAWADAQRRAASGDGNGTLPDLQARVAEAYMRYLELLRDQWAQVDLSELDHVALLEIGRSVTAAAVDAGSAVGALAVGQPMPIDRPSG
jgi:kumamolisin